MAEISRDFGLASPHKIIILRGPFAGVNMVPLHASLLDFARDMFVRDDLIRDDFRGCGSEDIAIIKAANFVGRQS